ncbi:helix-turn-helix domain-containing protein [Micromonospora fluostatini]|uniref:Helix-turn-helix domain-containing protein n=1 Tax=Micromonospora fluostatini TaxID=1629071 RepID=A0ABY2DGY6_9ACTN|nr:helix-turn-helix domain-containing protein [Micromonospora fluostatini]
MAANELGEFLRARRARRRPEEVGMPRYGQRRVAGLRREELAVLAGVSVDYYTRLEQGRERHPSAQVVDALAEALDLDPDAREHLYRLAGLTATARRGTVRDTVAPALRQLMDLHLTAPAFVTNRLLDVLATNALADALFAPFAAADNLARMIFVDPTGRWFHARWDRAARAAVAHLRQAVGHDAGDPRLHALIRTLGGASEEFLALWNSHDVWGKTTDGKELHHPDVGALSLTYQTFDVRDAPGQQLIVYQAEPGSRSAEALTLLGTLAATRRDRTAPARPPGPGRRPTA